MPRTLKPLSLILIVALGLAVTSCRKENGDQAAARVGSHDITMAQVDIAIKRQLDAGGGSSSALNPVEVVAARLSVLDNLIQEEALYQKAQKDNLVPDDNKVTQEIQKRKQDAHLTEEQYQNQLKQAGIAESEWREQIKRSLAIDALKDREKTRVKPPGDSDIEKYYGDHKNEFVADRGADISIIVTDPANNGAADDAIGDAAAEQKIRAIYDQLKAGSDFATVASQRSEDPSSAVRGGNLGFASETQLKQSFPTRPEVPQQLMSMNPGQFTAPIKDNLAGKWYIFKLNSKLEQPKNYTLEEVRQTVVDKITQERQQVLLNALVMVATTDISVKNYLAERIVENPDTILTTRPSQLLEQSKTPGQQPQPRIENETQSQNADRGRPAATGASGANSNRFRPSSNK